VSDSDQGGGGHKVGIVAGLLAVLGGAGKFADDCGRAARVGGAATHVGDDAFRGAGRLGGVGDDLGRAGVGVTDDALRAGRMPGALEAGSPVRLGEGALAKVADDAAPGAGHSVEEALAEAGMDLTLEVVSLDLPDEGEDLPARSADPTKPAVIVTTENARHHTEFLGRAVPGSLVVLVGKANENGAIAFAGQQLSDTEVHTRCAEREARCVVVTCPQDATPGCLSLASGMGRMASERVPLAGDIRARHAQLVYALLDQRAKTQATEIGISRVDPRADKVVRTKLKSVDRRAGDH
jgi:hypothetical protein